MKKTDIHLHLTKEQFPKNEQMFLSSAEHMLPHLKELGIQRGILMSSGEGRMARSFGTNDECREIATQFSGTYDWMCNLDAAEDETVYERLKKYKDQGAVGIGELMINKRLSDSFLQNIFAAAEQFDLPVLFHMSPQVGYEYGVVDEPGLPLLEENLKRYPKLKFIGHSQPFWHEISGDAKPQKEERMAWGEGRVTSGGRVPYLFEHYTNLYGDLSANSGGCAIMRDETFGLSFLEAYKERLLFGTDMVNIEMEFPLGSWLDDMFSKGKLGKTAYENICWKNANNLFCLE